VSDLPPSRGNIMENQPDVSSSAGSSQEDDHWERFCRLVQSGRLRIAPTGLDPRASAGFPWKRHAKRAGMTIFLTLVGLGVGWLAGSPVLAGVCALVLVAGFWWILIAGAPDPFHEPYLKNPTLFERSYLSGGVLLYDTHTRLVHEYPTEWRRIVTEI
jgi:hypothetical protein